MVNQRKCDSPERQGPEEDVLRSVRRRIDDCQHGFIFRKVSAEFHEGELILRGKVPSFYLKQNLQQLLSTIPSVSKITNQVDVISSNGLSSVRRESTAQ